MIKIHKIIDPVKSKNHTFRFYTLPNSFNIALFQSYTLPVLHSSNPTLFQSYTLHNLHSSNPTLFQSYTLPILNSSTLTLFQSYTLPISKASKAPKAPTLQHTNTPTHQHTNTPTLQHSNTLKIHKFRKSVTTNQQQPTHNVDTRDPTGSKKLVDIGLEVGFLGKKYWNNARIKIWPRV